MKHLAKRVDTLHSAINPGLPDTSNGVFICPSVNGELVVSPEDQARYQARTLRGLGCILLPEKDTPA